ncbi:MAG: outer membrane beta-barrel protein [Saprospiraceae bacterium]
MEDLFKQFRDNLENRPEPKFEEQDWRDMQARLKRDARTGTTAFTWWWMAVPFMLLLTGSNAFFFWQWKKAVKQVSNLEFRHDTVFHTRIVYTTDTVYRTRVIRERVVDYQNTYTPGRSNLLFGANEFSVSEKKKGLIDNLISKGELTEANQPIQQDLRLLPIDAIHRVNYPKNNLYLAYYSPTIPPKKYKRSFADHLYTARPKGYQVGLSGGFAHPYGRGVDFKSGYSIGGHGAIEFSPSLRLWADAAYFKTLFFTDRMGDEIGVPMVAAPSSEYLFLKAEVPQPFFQYSLGMQYLFYSKHKLKPFVGLGFGAISLLPYDVTYEFENTTLGVEWNLDQEIHRQGLITNFLVLPVGLEYGLSKHWNAQVQATYRYNWKETGIRSPDMFGIQGGLNYRF